MLKGTLLFLSVIGNGQTPVVAEVRTETSMSDYAQSGSTLYSCEGGLITTSPPADGACKAMDTSGAGFSRSSSAPTSYDEEQSEEYESPKASPPGKTRLRQKGSVQYGYKFSRIRGKMLDSATAQVRNIGSQEAQNIKVTGTIAGNTFKMSGPSSLAPYKIGSYFGDVPGRWSAASTIDVSITCDNCR